VDRASHVRLMATYNEWMNSRLYAACATLPADVLAADRKAFFGSIIGTLNHLANGDLIWLARFARHPAAYQALADLPGPLPGSLGAIRHPDLAALAAERRRIDAAILGMAGAVTEADFDHTLSYANSQGVVWERNFFALLMHFFNHQTHHRGQVTTLLSQEGVDVGVTDLLALVPNELQG
jgi:uncharacterized damage-inducible protein DinB